MKHILLYIALFFTSITYAQTGISTETPNAAAVLEVVAKNNNTGVLIPSFATADLGDITTPTHGLLIYNTTKNKFMYNAGTSGTPLWTFVGDIPAVTDISLAAAGVAGDIRYDLATDQIWYWKVGTGWTQLQSVPGP